LVYIDDNTKQKIQKIKLDTTYFLINFDNVLTDNSSGDTWNIITTNTKLKKAYTKKIEALNAECISIELDSGLSSDEKCEAIKYVWEELIDLFKEFNVDDNKIKRLISNKSSIKIREGAKNFLKLLDERKIPVIIISDGIVEIIKCFLFYNDCDYENIQVLANSIFSDTDINKIIHPLNKNEFSMPDEAKEFIKGRKTCVLLASSINDINMLSKDKLNDSIKIAFLDKNINENFDIFLNYFNAICTHNTPLDIITDKYRNMSFKKIK
jgi:2-hydroxy-3-keto-5-methylthiopentenyl-1-phosphate phosphatase